VNDDAEEEPLGDEEDHEDREARERAANKGDSDIDDEEDNQGRPEVDKGRKTPRSERMASIAAEVSAR
jgi:hypothetical protein